jgi:hypothetical protein
MSILDTIITKLRDIEAVHNITIIYAVEAGSRIYGYSSESSDYDVRFVYFNNDIKKYVSISKNPDSLTKETADDSIIDWAGWDIRKATQHLKESNPSIIEWLHSPIIYIDTHDFKQKCISILRNMHSHLSLMYHYVNMAKTNWATWIENKDKVICKKYFYVLRPLEVLVYIMNKYNTNDNDLVIMTNLEDLTNEIRSLIPENVFNDIQLLIEHKKTMDSKELCEPIASINEWTLDTFIEFENLIKRNKIDNDVDNDVDFNVQAIIKTHKKLKNETKKIIDITNSCGSTSRSNYLSAIGFALQVLWISNNPDKNFKSTPTQISQLLKDIQVDTIISQEIFYIVNEREETVLTETNNMPDRKNITKEDIWNHFVEPGIRFLAKDKLLSQESDLVTMSHLSDIDPSSILSDILGFKTDNTLNIIMPTRNDFAYHALKNYFNLLKLLCLDETQSVKSADVLTIDNLSNMVPIDVIERSINTISRLKPKYVVEQNDILLEWLNYIITTYEKHVNDAQKNLIKIRELNAQKRLKNSIKQINQSEFDDLISGILF